MAEFGRIDILVNDAYHGGDFRTLLDADLQDWQTTADVNIWGTLCGVVILAVGISGIQQLGGSFWVEPLFNGVTLLIAIGIAGYAQRRRAAAGRATLLEKPRPASADLITERGNT